VIRGLVSSDQAAAARPFEPTVRDRVQARFAQASAYRVVLVAAPAGFGKSVAARHYLDLAAPGHLRISLRREHGTFLGLLRALTRALEAIEPNVQANLTAVYEAAERSKSPVADIAEWFAAVLRTYRGTIFIDDLHHIRPDPRVGEFLTEIVERTSEHVRWIFSTRDPLELPVASWLAYGLADMPIDEVDLRLTRPEAVLAARSYGVTLRDDTLDALLELTGGWTTAFGFALRASTRTSELERVAKGTREMVYAFLADQVFRSLEPASREFLLATALLPALELDVLRHASLGDARARIAELRRSTSFITEESERVFRYHDLFRDYLEHELRRDDMVHATASALAATWLEKAGRLPEALKLYVDGNAFAEALRILEAHGQELYDRVEIEVLEAAIAALPASFLDASPKVLALEATIAGLRADFERADRLFARALRATGDADVRASIAMRNAVSLLNRLRSEDALDLLGSVDTNAVATASLRARLLGIKAYALALRNDPEANDTAARALAAIAGTDDVASEVVVLQYVANVAFKNGRVDQASVYAGRAIELAERHGIFGAAGRIGSLLYAIAYERGDTQSSLFQLMRLRRNAERIGDRMMISYALMTAYEIYVERGDVEKIEAVERDLAANERDPAMTLAGTSVFAALAMQQAWAGNFGKAFETFEHSKSFADRPNPASSETVYRATLALYAAAAGRRGDAEAALARVLELLPQLVETGDAHSWQALSARLTAALAATILLRTGTALRLLRMVEADPPAAMPMVRAYAHVVRAVHIHAETGVWHEGLHAAFAEMRAAGYGGIVRLIEALPLPLGTANPAFGSLTPMEVRVLTKIASGETSREVADDMHRSALTIDSHVKSIVRKLHCRGRREAVAMARTQGIV
jgi:ATP/maltotriose-dependent transcriptional regulator MalT